jgi:hypothetical protein
MFWHLSRWCCVQWPAMRGISPLPVLPDPWFTGSMRRLLLPALATALLVGLFAGVASARFASDGGRATPHAPFRAPALMPTADVAQPHAWSFRSSEAIGHELERQAPAAPNALAAAGSATVTVTAVVLPVVIIVLDPKTGDVDELFTNTDQRDARGVVYLVREGSEDGTIAELTPAIWAQARAGLAHADAGTGSIWSA